MAKSKPESSEHAPTLPLGHASDADIASPYDTIRATIAPAQRGPDTGGARAMALLRGLSSGRSLGVGTALVLEETLGQGGMGIVHLATQKTFDRKVAVKTLRPETASDAAAMQLLREAWIGGQLEHPNIVPVYDLSLDDNGHPVIVMRRIGGTDWGSLFLDAETVEKQFGARDLLEWNLGILIQVCNAVHFAHERGIVHRDLKVDNVRVGDLGEVYLLDWGIAVAMQDDGSGRLPLQKDVNEIAGTPCYMAPEMFFVETAKIGPRTDVYLLGAILYELLIGRPPHNGTSLEEIRDQIQRTVRLPSTVPSALRAICERALANDPDERFDSVIELRNALRDYLQLRGSMLLVEASQEKRRELEARMQGGGSTTDLHNLLAQCRFGYQQALERWPENPVARHELAEVLGLMVRYEIEHGDLHTAAVLLGALDEQPLDLVKLLDDARARAAEEHERRRKLEAMGKDQDPTVGARTRVVVGVVFSLLWGLLSLGYYFMPPTHDSMTYFSAGVVAVVLVVGVALRRVLFATRFNAVMFSTVVVVTATQAMLYPVAGVMGVSIRAATTLPLLFYFFACAVLAFVSDRRMIYAAGGFLVAFFVAAFAPLLIGIAGALSNTFLAAVIFFTWGETLGTTKGPLEPC